MAWGHSVATVVIDATDQQGIGFGACDRVIVALVVELGLHRVKKITIEDGGLLAGKDLALECDLADVEPIPQRWASGPRVNGIPPTVRPVLRDRTLVTIPCSRRSAINRLRLPSSKYRRKMVRTRSASSSTTTILRSLVSYPSGAMPPTHSPLRLEAAILSRMRSEVTSRSNWAKDNRTFSVSRPMEVVVLNCWVTETNDTPWPSNSSTSLAKSASDLVRRSTL